MSMQVGSPMMNLAAAKVLTRIPGFRRLPLVELLILAEVVMLAKEHLERLTPRERRRLISLVRETKGRPGNLSAARRRELGDLIAKAEPKRFASTAFQKLSPLPLSRRA